MHGSLVIVIRPDREAPAVKAFAERCYSDARHSLTWCPATYYAVNNLLNTGSEATHVFTKSPLTIAAAIMVAMIAATAAASCTATAVTDTSLFTIAGSQTSGGRPTG